MIKFLPAIKEAVEIPTGSAQWDITTNESEKLEYICQNLLDQCLEAFQKSDVKKIPVYDFYAMMINLAKQDLENSPNRKEDMMNNAAIN